MAHYSEEGAIPISRARLWEFLQLHSDPATISQIHPEVLQQTIQSSSPEEIVLERTLRVTRRKTLHSTWKVSLAPPDQFRWEIVGGEGPLEVGSWVENRYSDAPDGETWVRTEADLRLQKIPGFLQKAAARRILRAIDAQDISYLQTHP